MINIAQIGIGYWGSNLLRVFSNLDGACLQVACDVQLDKYGAIVEKHPDIKFITDYQSLVHNPDIDGVVIATPAETHYQIAKQFLQQNKHVFVEKPFVLNVAHAEELTELAEEVGCILMVGHLLLYHPAYIELKRRVQSPEFGDLHYIMAARASLGKVRSNENVMWSFAPHDIALVLDLIEEIPADVTATGHAYMQAGIEDVSFLILTFPSGRMAHIHSSWMFPRKVRLLTVVGSKQMIELDDTKMTDKLVIHQIDTQRHRMKDIKSRGYEDRYEYESITFKRGDTIIPHIDYTEPLKLECQHFIDCIKTGKEPITSGKASLEVVRTIDKAQKFL